MNQLIARFDLQSRHVLSVGAGTAHEEYWFVRAGGMLTLVDLDEHGLILPHLRALPCAATGGGGGTVRYVVGDARTWAGSTPLQRTFDVCYFSSFTPDEMHRGNLQAQRPSVWRKLRDAGRNYLGVKLGTFGSWPAGADPYSDLVIDVVNRSLAPGGLFVNQSYCSGVDIRANPHFVDDVRRQLRSIGIELLELYHFMPEETAVSLTIALRGSESEARAYVERLRERPALTDFHGRSTVKRYVQRISPFEC